MRRLLAIALRNVLRNKWRSFISALAIVIGVGAVTFLQGFGNGFLQQVVEDAVQDKVGAIQVHKRGYLDAETDPLKLDLPDDPQLAATLRSVPGVTAVTRRLSFEGMLSNGSVSSMFTATAIDPATEYQVCPRRAKSVAEGSRPIDAASTEQALIGTALGDSLQAKAGATLTMLSASREGASNALDVTVRGFLPSRFIMESKRSATVPLAFAQDLLRMPGRVTEYVLAVDQLERVDEVARQLRARLGDGYEVHTWLELQPIARDAVARLRYVLVFVALILFLLVVSGIVNTMLMSVYERVREIGTMMAVGVRRRQVVALFLAEAGALGLGGALAGGALGLSVVRWLGARGMHFKVPGGEPMVIHPTVTAAFVGIAIAAAVVGALLAALYPAWKASRLKPVDALRAN